MPGPGHATVWDSNSSIRRPAGGWAWLRHGRRRVMGGWARVRRDQAQLPDHHWDAAREQLWLPSGDSVLEQATAQLGPAGALTLHAAMLHST